MSEIRADHTKVFSGIANRLRNAGPYLFIPVALIAVAGFLAFRSQPAVTLNVTNVDSLQLPAGWPELPVPPDNPITSAKFVLGRQLFYETSLSSDGKTSCASCHNGYQSFAAGGPRVGASGDSNKPFRNVPRLMNVAYDTVLTWD